MKKENHTLFGAIGFGVSVILVWLIMRTWTLVICPEWHVEVLDKSEGPFVNLKVRQEWVYYGFSTLKDESKLTNSSGEAVFPARIIRQKGPKIILTRLLGLISAHSSFGPRAKVSLPLNSFERNDSRILHKMNHWVTKVTLPYNQSLQPTLPRDAR
jgi:hypothetical protein